MTNNTPKLNGTQINLIKDVNRHSLMRLSKSELIKLCKKLNIANCSSRLDMINKIVSLKKSYNYQSFEKIDLDIHDYKESKMDHGSTTNDSHQTLIQTLHSIFADEICGEYLKESSDLIISYFQSLEIDAVKFKLMLKHNTFISDLKSFLNIKHEHIHSSLSLLQTALCKKLKLTKYILISHIYRDCFINGFFRDITKMLYIPQSLITMILQFAGKMRVPVFDTYPEWCENDIKNNGAMLQCNFHGERKDTITNRSYPLSGGAGIISVGWNRHVFYGSLIGFDQHMLDSLTREWSVKINKLISSSTVERDTIGVISDKSYFKNPYKDKRYVDLFLVNCDSYFIRLGDPNNACGNTHRIYTGKYCSNQKYSVRYGHWVDASIRIGMNSIITISIDFEKGKLCFKSNDVLLCKPLDIDATMTYYPVIGSTGTKNEYQLVSLC